MAARLLGSMVLALGLSTLSWAADTNEGGCTAPKAAEPTSAVEVPQYAMSDDEDAPDPAEEARKRAWGDYQHQLIASLKASSDPRDWALAASFDLGSSSVERAENAALLRRAAQALPNDVLVQWIVLTGAPRLNAADLASDALDRLTRIEPDNGEVWMEWLQRAAMQHDRAGVTAALSQMSAASRTDTHFPDITNFVADAFERNPMPEELTPSESGFSLKASPYVYAMNIAAAFALPAYQYLTVACQWDESGRNADRAADCERVGRLMSRDSDTLIGQAIGFAVLRVSHTFNDDDIEAARRMDWVVRNFSDLAAKPGRVAIGDTKDEIAAAYHKDWLETHSETEAMRRRVMRSGLSPTPPDSWVGQAPRFAPERIEESDKNGAEKLAKAGY